MTNLGIPFRINKCWKSALVIASNVYFMIVVLYTNPVTSSMFHSILVSPLLVGIYPGYHSSVNMIFKGSDDSSMLRMPKDEQSALFSSWKYAQDRNNPLKCLVGHSRAPESERHLSKVIFNTHVIRNQGQVAC